MTWTASESAILITSLNANNSYSFREVPTFGRDKIRKFVENASEMKKLAARNYEDLLQVVSFTAPAPRYL
jgi:hypothetical protein